MNCRPPLRFSIVLPPGIDPAAGPRVAVEVRTVPGPGDSIHLWHGPLGAAPRCPYWDCWFGWFDARTELLRFQARHPDRTRHLELVGSFLAGDPAGFMEMAVAGSLMPEPDQPYYG